MEGNDPPEARALVGRALVVALFGRAIGETREVSGSARVRTSYSLSQTGYSSCRISPMAFPENNSLRGDPEPILLPF